MSRTSSTSALLALFIASASSEAHAQDRGESPPPATEDMSPPSEAPSAKEKPSDSESEASETSDSESKASETAEEPKDSAEGTQDEEAPQEPKKALENDEVPHEEAKRPDPLKGKSKEEKKALAAESEKNADPSRNVEAAQTMKRVEDALKERSYKPWDEVGDTKFDWLRTTSGEWLKGEIKELRDEDLVIDSDEFDLQTLSWSDISDIHSPNRFTYVLDDKAVHSGTAEMTKGKLIVHTKAGPRVFDKNRLMTIIPESVREISKWSFKLSLGATGSYGNSEVMDYSAFTRLRREDAFNRATAEYHGAYGIASEEENTNRHRGNLTWNIYVSPLFYITPYSGELLYDKFQNIALRTLASAGVGVHAVDTKDVSLDFDTSGGYVGTNFISVEDLDDDHQKDAVVVPHLNLEWDITDDIEFEFDWRTALVVTEIANTFHQGTTMLSIEITDVFDFDLSASYSRMESPVTNEDGTTPDKDDLSITIGIGLDID